MWSCELWSAKISLIGGLWSFFYFLNSELCGKQSFFFKLKKNLLCLFPPLSLSVCVFVFMGVYMPWQVCRGQRASSTSWLSLTSWVPGIELRLGGKHLYLPSLLAGLWTVLLVRKCDAKDYGVPSASILRQCVDKITTCWLLVGKPSFLNTHWGLEAQSAHMTGVRT